MGQTVYIFYSKILHKLPHALFTKYLDELPFVLREKNQKYIRWQDRQAHLFGKLLVKKAFAHLGFKGNALNEIRLGKYKKPYVLGNIYFNITHSGDYVACAVTRRSPIGIDIQEVLEIDFKDFEYTMKPEQWSNILSSPSPLYTFFRYWTIKESMIKADGRGMYISLLEIVIDSKYSSYKGQKWYYKEFNMNSKYCFTLSSKCSNIKAELVAVDIQ